jgi:hypothetical protein
MDEKGRYLYRFDSLTLPILDCRSIHSLHYFLTRSLVLWKRMNSRSEQSQHDRQSSPITTRGTHSRNIRSRRRALPRRFEICLDCRSHGYSHVRTNWLCRQLRRSLHQVALGPGTSRRHLGRWNSRCHLRNCRTVGWTLEPRR